jgi:Flp pilus assembly pilin Flp
MRRLQYQLHHTAMAAYQRLCALSARLSVEVGQGLVEYSLLLMLIMVVCVAIVTILGGTVSEHWYDRILQTFPD